MVWLCYLAGVDSAWEQEKLKARKMLDCEACGGIPIFHDTPRFVRRRFI